MWLALDPRHNADDTFLVEDVPINTSDGGFPDDLEDGQMLAFGSAWREP